MERDLNLKRLIRMYILNSWIIICVGVLFALGIMVSIETTNQVTYSKSVFLVYDLEREETKDIEVIKNTYFDAYKGLLSGNILNREDVFSEEEKQKLQKLDVSIEYSSYTVSMTLEDDGKREENAEVLEKYIKESEKWMREKYNDDTFHVETLKEDIISVENESTIMKMAVGFVIGALLVSLGLFVWFVVDKKIRTEEDVLYYTGLDCLTTVKRGDKNEKNNN